MAKLQTPQHLRERLAALVEQSGSVRGAAEALGVDPRRVARLLTPDSAAPEELIVFMEVRLQIVERARDRFGDLQRLAGSVIDVMAETGARTARDLADIDPSLHRKEAADILLRAVEGIPAPDGRSLADAGQDDQGRTLWAVLPPPTSAAVQALTSEVA